MQHETKKEKKRNAEPKEKKRGFGAEAEIEKGGVAETREKHWN